MPDERDRRRLPPPLVEGRGETFEERLEPTRPRIPRPSDEPHARTRELARSGKERASQVESELASVIGAMTAHNARQEADLLSLKRAVVLLAREHGVEKRLDANLLESMPPPAPPGASAPPTTKAIAEQSRDRAKTAAIVAAVSPVAVELLRHLPDLVALFHHVP